MPDSHRLRRGKAARQQRRPFRRLHNVGFTGLLLAVLAGVGVVHVLAHRDLCPRAEKAAAFGQTLRQLTGLPVTLWDERRTTIDAHNILFNNGQNAKKRKKTVDAVAAALMLEGYLTRKRLEAER